MSRVIMVRGASEGRVIMAQGANRRSVIKAGMRGAPGLAGVYSFNTRTGIVTLIGTDVTDALGYTPADGASLASVAFSGSYLSLTDKPFIPTMPGDIGAASAAQGALADTAVQPAALAVQLDLKVDKITGYGLSQENFTTAEKAKLAGLDGNLWKGEYTTLAALQAAHPTAEPGSSANVDAGIGTPVLRYIWDGNDNEWVAQAGSADPITAAQVKTLYESNPDTNAYTDAEKSKLGGIAAGATANPNTDSLSEGATNKWFTAARVIAAVLTGLSVATGGVVVDTDTVLAAVGKLQKQITDLAATVGGKQDALVSGTTIKTVNGSSLLGAGNLVIEGGGGGLATFDVVAAEALAAGDFVNIYTDTGVAKARKADGGAAKRKAHGFVEASVLVSATASVTPLGGSTSALTGLTPGAEYFLSTVTPGAVQLALPNSSNTLRQALGVAVSATQLATTDGLAVELA